VPDEQGAHELEAVVHRGVGVGVGFVLKRKRERGGFFLLRDRRFFRKKIDVCVCSSSSSVLSRGRALESWCPAEWPLSRVHALPRSREERGKEVEWEREKERERSFGVELRE
jgi:hypothetical protein